MNLETTRGNWNIIKSSNYEDIFIGKVLYVNNAAHDATKKNSEKLVCVTYYLYQYEGDGITTVCSGRRRWFCVLGHEYGRVYLIKLIRNVYLDIFYDTFTSLLP